MKYYAPDYYGEFVCIADRCRHSCCAGWEIDIDGETLEKYRRMDNETGRRIRENVVTDGETTSFRMTADGRCPFLNERGLCKLILAEGPDILCQICADHPRFRNFFADREEIGLGMCCEAATRLILTREQPTKLILIEDDGDGEAADETELALLELRDHMIKLMQDRTMATAKRVDRMLSEAGIAMIEPDFAEWAQFLMTLERLDDAWAERLTELRDVPASEEGLFDGPEWEIAFEQLMVALLYRNLPAAMQDGDADGRIACAALMWLLIRRLCAVHAALHGSVTIEDMVELTRLYSSEIEYSDVNMDEILDELYRVCL